MTSYVDVMEHQLEGLEWTIGQVGTIQGPAHTTDFALEWMSVKPVVRKDWHIVSIENNKAKGGFALAALPMEHLAPHACTERCGKHLC